MFKKILPIFVFVALSFSSVFAGDPNSKVQWDRQVLVNDPVVEYEVAILPLGQDMNASGSALNTLVVAQTVVGVSPSVSLGALAVGLVNSTNLNTIRAKTSSGHFTIWSSPIEESFNPLIQAAPQNVQVIPG